MAVRVDLDPGATYRFKNYTMTIENPTDQKISIFVKDTRNFFGENRGYVEIRNTGWGVQRVHYDALRPLFCFRAPSEVVYQLRAIPGPERNCALARKALV